MSPIAFFTLCLLTIVALLAMSQVQLINDVFATTGLPVAEIWAGIGGILFILYTVIAVFTMR